MSQIPKVAHLPKPKSVRAKDPANTVEHAELLTLAWTHLEKLARQLYPAPADKLRESTAALWEDHCEHLASLEEFARAQAAARRADAAAADPAGELEAGALLLDAAAAELAKLQKAPPLIPPEYLVTTLDEAALATPLPLESSSRREEPVGFVDITCRVTWPTELTVSRSTPTALSAPRARSLHPIVRDTLPRAWSPPAESYEYPELDDDSDSTFAVSVGRTRHASLASLQGLKLTPAEWYRHTASVELWLDIRPTDVPIGQLLRELKTLQSYAPPNGAILVILNQASNETLAMLAHEGFATLTREALLALAST